jgi:phosphatidylserine/phosphatidylglycerophosphate/cardiolipin synthase-like enzyme
VYVHAKVCVVDDAWMCVGSDNANRRSWTHDSELSAAVRDQGSDLPRRLRLGLAAEHLDCSADDVRLTDAEQWAEAYRQSAATLDAWYAQGRVGPRPRGHLRAYGQPTQPLRTRIWATPLYRLVYDPDGRSPVERVRHRY